MRRHLAAINGLAGAHGLLDKGVARLGQNGDAALLSDNFLRVPNHSGVVDNFAAGLFF